MSHVTNDCWELEKNSFSRPSTWQSKLDEEFDEINEEVIVSAGSGEGELQEQEESTAD
jgi:hypothetical protein